MWIGELAEATEVTRETLRFYERKGLIRSERSANGYRSYRTETADLVRCIRRAQALGFSLAEIGHQMPEVWAAADPAAALSQALNARLADIDARIADLVALRQTIAQLQSVACPFAKP